MYFYFIIMSKKSAIAFCVDFLSTGQTMEQVHHYVWLHHKQNWFK